MKIVEGAAAARAGILKRQPASETELGPAGRARNREVFGAELSASEAVARIIRDVRSEGDAAVQRYGKAFDGAESRNLEVPREEIDVALKSIEPDLRQALEFAAGR